MLKTHRSAITATAPRKVLLSIPNDRKAAAMFIRAARKTVIDLNLAPCERYDRTLFLAAGLAWLFVSNGHPKAASAAHIAHILNAAAID